MSTAIIGHHQFVQLSTGKVQDSTLDDEHSEENPLKSKLVGIWSRVGNLNMCIGTVANVRKRDKSAWPPLKDFPPEILKAKVIKTL